MSVKLKNKENTFRWYEEYISKKDIDMLGLTNLLEEDLGGIENRSVVFLAEFGGVSAVVLTYKRGGSCIVVPISEYNFPSSEFEVLLPKSNLVLQTWNARVCVHSTLKDAIGKISNEDMHIALSHYNAVFENSDFKFPTLVGEPLAEIEEDFALSLDKYLYEEALSLPESQFIVMPQDLSLQVGEYEDSIDEDGDSDGCDIIDMFNPYGVAATPLQDNEDDDDIS